MPVSAAHQAQYRRQSPELGRTGGAIVDGEGSEVEVFRAVDQFLDLGRRSQGRLGAFRALNSGEQALFASHLRDLLRLGIVGTETLEVHGEPRHVFVDTAYADPQLRDASQYRRRPAAQLDLRA